MKNATFLGNKLHGKNTEKFVKIRVDFIIFNHLFFLIFYYNLTSP